jgi:formate-dependent nitrite reductase membrane component NrfD
MSDVTGQGMQDVRPGREAVRAVQMDGERGPRRGTRPGAREEPIVGQAAFRSYYGVPVINQPVWEAADIATYLFLGGLAGASSVVAAGAQMSGRPSLARVTKVASTAAIGLSGVALVHDLGRPARFLNMLRVFKPTSPLSMGSWLLAAFAPLSAAASFSAVTGRLPVLGALGTAGAALMGPGVATYAAALISDTAVPAWHGGYRYLPFVFASSAASAAAGLGLAAAPRHETAPMCRLGVAAGMAELVLLQTMKRRIGVAGEAYAESEKGRRYGRAASAATAAGIALAAALGRRSRLAGVLAGTALLAGSALTRFAIFEAGLTSAQNPRYTIVPQRQRSLAQQGRAAGS